jgi:ABC-2 type transport system permease protein
VLAILALIGPCTAPLSYAAGPWLRSEDALAPLMNTVVLPLLLLSGILLPMTLASINPFSHAVNAARSLFNGQFGDSEVAIGVAVTIVLAGVSLWIASRSFSRAAA